MSAKHAIRDTRGFWKEIGSTNAANFKLPHAIDGTRSDCETDEIWQHHFRKRFKCIENSKSNFLVSVGLVELELLSTEGICSQNENLGRRSMSAQMAYQSKRIILVLLYPWRTNVPVYWNVKKHFCAQQYDEIFARSYDKIKSLIFSDSRNYRPFTLLMASSFYKREYPHMCTHLILSLVSKPPMALIWPSSVLKRMWKCI